MNLKINHHMNYCPEIIKSFDHNAIIASKFGFLINAILHPKVGVIIPELASRRENPIIYHHYGMFLLLLLLPVTFSAYAGSIWDGVSRNIISWIIMLSIVFLFFIVFIPVARLLIQIQGETKYLIFRDNQVTMQSRFNGRRNYLIKDLKFHLISIYNEQVYFLEVELPDLTLPDKHRLIIIEAAASMKTMEGLLAVFLPLIRGDMQAYLSAKKRHYVRMRWEDIPRMYRISNIWGHLGVWFHYWTSEISLKILHGSREKIMQKELALLGE